jgi:hypothetical protein
VYVLDLYKMLCGVTKMFEKQTKIWQGYEVDIRIAILVLAFNAVHTFHKSD